MSLILIVDDEQPILDLLSDLIEDAGHTSLTAHHGMEALARIYQQCPTLILSDVMMPMMDGGALAQALSDDPAYSAIPIVLMSEGTYVPRMSPNVIGFLHKPFTISLIEGFLQRLT